MPLRMNTVVVFGDSLSDIGNKWVTKSGRLARLFKQVRVSPSGRFSDCRTWTDYMYEAATGKTLIVDSAAATIKLSRQHTSYDSKNCMAQYASYNRRPEGAPPPFGYANYAEGGACGYRPVEKARFLGTFQDQVDAFEQDCMASHLPLRDTLFIIWFGANDLYTSNRRADEMHQVAQEVADRQRNRLVEIFRTQNHRKRQPTTAAPQRNRVLQLIKKNNQTTDLPGSEIPDLHTCKFVFVDMCTPLSSVRYANRLQRAEQRPRSDLGHAGLYAEPVDPKRRLSGADDTLRQAEEQGLRAAKLRAQIDDVKNLEDGVKRYNQALAGIAAKNKDRVVKLGEFISEDTIAQLVLTPDCRLKVGAMKSSVKKHIAAWDYDKGTEAHPVAIIDEVHPTDHVHKLIWREILKQIKASDSTFGLLDPLEADDPPYDLGQEMKKKEEKRREEFASRCLS
jgi:hypothetical protein